MEIERKFIIKKPKPADFRDIVARYEIKQVYLNFGEDCRIRARKNMATGEVNYFFTEKLPVSFGVRIENETEISKSQFLEYLKKRDTRYKTVSKTRVLVRSYDKIFEIDLYPFWKTQAVMEIELNDINEPFIVPSWVKIKKEVTDDKRYSNKNIALTGGKISGYIVQSCNHN